MTAVIHSLWGGAARLLALGALVGLLGAGWLSLAPAAADGHDKAELLLSIVEDSDNMVPPGGTFSLRAQIRYNASLEAARWTEVLAGSHLRLSGDLDWDDRDNVGAALRIPARNFDSPPAQALALTPLDAAGAAYDTTTGAGSGVWPVAFDGRTLVARAGTTNGLLQIFDLSADPPAQVATIAGVADEQLGGQAIAADAAIAARSVAVWDQDETTAWIFAGAPRANTNEGKLYIYKVSYGAAGATVSASPTTLAVPMSEYTNRVATAWPARYGGAVSISADGSTLAVGAREIHAAGAVYVYTMPDGAGEDWSDLDYADGVKVTPYQVPAWGTAGSMPNTRPFDQTSSTVGGAYNQCDAYCSSVYASRNSSFGASVELSADGSTLVVGAPRKRYSGTTAGGSFTPANFSQNAGGVWVFSAPAGGWSAAPDATAGKTEIAAQASAAAWDPATNYSPGPAKRVESAAAELIPGAYGTSRTADAFFGEPVNISADGGTVVVTARRQGVSSSARTYVFEQPDGGWADDSSADATITENATLGFWGADVNYNGGRVLVADAAYDTTAPALTDVGAVYVFERADGGWSGTLGASDAAEVLTAPTPETNGFFAAPRYNNAGTRPVYAQTDYNGHATTAPKLWAAAPGPDCSERTLEGETMTTCTVSLGNTNVTVALGTPEGPFTISGSLGLRFDDGTETTARGSLAAEVRKVDELTEVDFDFATDTKGTESTEDDTPYPSQVTVGGSTTLLLRLLNENGKASARGAAASVLLSTTRGTLSARVGEGSEAEACVATGGLACRIANPARVLTADNADKVRLTVTHPGVARAGTARVRVVVVSSAGRTFSMSREVIFGGPPTAMAIAEPAASLLSYDPTGATDERNMTTLVVSATDRAGNKATVPTTRYSAKLTDPDGKAVALTGGNARAGVVWPVLKGGTGDDAAELVLRDGNPQARVSVLAPAAAPLAVGKYTLELTAGSGAGKLTATQMFTVAGGAANVSLSVEPTGELEVEDELTATAMVTDSSGGPVPDGTQVSFTEQSIGAGTTLVLVSQSRQPTRNGEASVTLRAVGGGGAYVQASADGLSDIESVRVVMPPPPPEPVTSTAVDAFTVWTSAQTITAAELLSRLPGVTRVSIWIGGKWFVYGLENGRRVAGSVDFPITRGNVLWLASD